MAAAHIWLSALLILYSLSLVVLSAPVDEDFAPGERHAQQPALPQQYNVPENATETSWKPPAEEPPEAPQPQNLKDVTTYRLPPDQPPQPAKCPPERPRVVPRPEKAVLFKGLKPLVNTRSRASSPRLKCPVRSKTPSPDDEELFPIDGEFKAPRQPPSDQRLVDSPAASGRSRPPGFRHPEDRSPSPPPEMPEMAPQTGPLDGATGPDTTDTTDGALPGQLDDVPADNPGLEPQTSSGEGEGTGPSSPDVPTDAVEGDSSSAPNGRALRENETRKPAPEEPAPPDTPSWAQPVEYDTTDGLPSSPAPSSSPTPDGSSASGETPNVPDDQGPLDRGRTVPQKARIDRVEEDVGALKLQVQQEKDKRALRRPAPPDLDPDPLLDGTGSNATNTTSPSPQVPDEVQWTVPDRPTAYVSSRTLALERLRKIAARVPATETARRRWEAARAALNNRVSRAVLAVEPPQQ